jgi:DNA-binding response OmpR family regulator
MIFIVDDDAATRESLRLLLEAEGFKALDFAAGTPFREAVRPSDGDFLILDINMPGMSGFEVLEELRRRGAGDHRHRQTDNATRARSIAAGAAALLEKPHGPDELLSLLPHVSTSTTS